MGNDQSLISNPQSPHPPISILLPLILPFFAIAPLFYPGYFQAHSGFTPVWNVVDLRANLGNLGWLPHIAVTFDPLRSDGLLPYYLAAVLPVEAVVAVKLVMGFGVLLGSVGMFLWLRGWLGQPGALTAALVYTYLPYHIVTLYAHGAWGETLFLGLLPWAILAAISSVTSPKWRLLPAAFFWLLLGLSQLGLAMWAFLLLVALFLATHWANSLLPMVAGFVGLTAASVMIFSLATVVTMAPVDFSDHFLYPFQLLSAYWGFGASRPGWQDGLSLQLGVAGIGLTMLTVILWQRRDQTQVSRPDRRLLFFSLAAILLILLQLGILAFIWRWPLSGTLTYPWQLLGLSGLCLAVLSGAALWLDAQLTRLPLLAAIVLFVLLGSYSYLEPRFIQPPEYDAPQALLGQNQLALLSAGFVVATSGHTAGLELGETMIPVAVHGPLQANDTLLLKVVWQPLRTFNQDLKIFAHLVDANNNVIAQFDGQPQQGQYPTSHWVPGELIEDTYPLLLPENAPPGPYRVFLGLYDGATLARLPVATDAEGRIILKVE